MDSEPKINIQAMLGTVEIKSWFEADFLPNGDIALNGKGCSITRNRYGSIRDLKFSDTGCALVIPMSHEQPRAPGLLARLWSRLRHNA